MVRGFDRLFRFLLPCLVPLAVAAGSGCSSGGDGGGVARIEGRAVKGNLNAAIVDVWAIGDIGAPIARIATTTTAANGSFSVETPNYAGWALLEVHGGTFTDESTGAPATIPADAPLLGVAYANGAVNDYVVTPLTSVLATFAMDQARDPGVSFDDAVSNAVRMIERMTGIADAHLTVPADLTAGPASANQASQYGAILAGISERAFTLSVPAARLAHGMRLDSADRTFDGKAHTEPIEIQTGIALPSDILESICFAAGSWLDSNPNNVSGLDSGDFPGLSVMITDGQIAPPAPRVRDVWNAHSGLSGGSLVTIRGFHFGSAPTVTVGGQNATVTTSSDDEITILTPSRPSAGDYDLSVTNDEALRYTLRAGIAYVSPSAKPVITDWYPREGPSAGGTEIVLEGANFTPGTQVLLGGTPAQVTGGGIPYQITAVAPKPAAVGTVTISVQNAAGSTDLTNAFTYKDKDVGRDFDDSDFNGPHTVLYGKALFGSGGLEYRFGTVLWNPNGSGTGTFTRHEMALSGAGASETTTSGSLFYQAEGRNLQIGTFDTGTNASNLYIGGLHTNGLAASGLTAGGNFYSFRHGAGQSNADLSGEYGVTMQLWTFSPKLSFGAYAGVMELDAGGRGGINLKGFERDGEGDGFREKSLNLDLSYDVSPDGELEFALDPAGVNVWNFRGRILPGGDFLQAYWNGVGDWQGSVASFSGMRLEDRVAAESLRGEGIGGFLQPRTFQVGLEWKPRIEVGLKDFLFEGGNRYFVGTDGVRLEEGAGEELRQSGKVVGILSGPRGRLEYDTGKVSGYYSPKLQMTIRAGEIAEWPAIAESGDRLDYGATVGIDRLFTKYSLGGEYNFVNAKSYWLNPGSSISGDEVNETRIGTVTLDPDKPLTIGGDAFGGFGGIDYSGSFVKRVTRSSLSASVTTGSDLDFKADFGYGFLNNRFRLMFAEIEDGSPLADYKPGFLEGLGLASPTGAFVGFGSNPNSGTTSFTALSPKRTGVTLSASYRYGQALYDFDGAGRTLGNMGRGTFSVSGSAFTQNYWDRQFVEGGSNTFSSGVRSGTIGLNPGGTVDFFVSGGPTLGGIAVGDNSPLLVLADLTSTSKQSGLVILTGQSAIAPPLLDYGYSQFLKQFFGTTLPAPTGLTLGQGTFTPTRNTLSVTGLNQVRYNDAADVALQRVLNTGTAAASATGGLTFNFGSTTYSGGLTPDGSFGFGLPGAESDAPTAMNLTFQLKF